MSNDREKMRLVQFRMWLEQFDAMQELADKDFDGNFSSAMRNIMVLGMELHERRQQAVSAV